MPAAEADAPSQVVGAAGGAGAYEVVYTLEIKEVVEDLHGMKMC